MGVLIKEHGKGHQPCLSASLSLPVGSAKKILGKQQGEGSWWSQSAYAASSSGTGLDMRIYRIHRIQRGIHPLLYYD